jgi:hypothetical protein
MNNPFCLKARFARASAVLGASALLLLLAIPGGAAPFISYSAGKADVVISHAEGDYLRVSTAVWGPNWAWSSFSGKSTGAQGLVTGNLSAKITGAAAPLPLRFQASRISPQPPAIPV